MNLVFDKVFAPHYGEAIDIAPNVKRITVNNPSPFTFHGTNSYLIGKNSLALIDPGPIDEAHKAVLLRAIGGRPVSHIFVSHTHRDHSPLASVLKDELGALVVAEGPHRPSRALHLGEVNLLDASGDTGFMPDIRVDDDALIEGDGWALRSIHTPGHTANHVVFALEGSGILFSADHVMAWATSIVAPPDGSMSDYMASLDRLLARQDRVFLPGHGGPVTRPKTFMRGLKAHRKMRERAVLERVKRGDRTIAEMVRVIYRETDPRLHGAAALSVLAHLEDLVARGLVQTEGNPAVDGIYW
ncbi:MBL fold metallo-hydrolase [Phyllobacterium endophyticum]|uniref:MBL fold metallo-hydrolase n=1 Tax=Phyllobacterium endophyticum TaxID=1149773 RepID=A0A2P7B1N7_9HYPH|nr:MBL fold metallo-hydrolase [Phyllobacterium endophyticum]MBB3237960.1 glyoxylase-like metal-dependent hydrolase (beta-lactamase superfamily II) [Phyllobacterium endophyticum]PSH60385.1 MBL fold metallo-hydrolase [Phyllobacterium endophyticum]TYR42562.1 MBL fold metallo-hydrolase [Phyllobacterium endophyticum]